MGQGKAIPRERESRPTYRSCFAHEWITVGDNRILIHQRDGAPSRTVRRAAMIAAWMLEECDDEESRVVECWYDNRFGLLRVVIGSPATNTESLFVPATLANVYDSIFMIDPEQVEVVVVAVPEGRRHADSYNHTEYVVRSVLTTTSQEQYLD
jgi:hypothetical protein